MTQTLPCPNCRAAIDVASAKWCDCLSKKLSIVCPHCKACFCKLRKFTMEPEWNVALRELLEQQTVEKFRRSLGVSTTAVKYPQTVLVVDDDEEIRLIAEYTITRMGYRVYTAADAEEGLAMAADLRPTIVLTDALMPKMDGRELCRRIKYLDPSIKVVVMSSMYTGSRYRIEAMNDFHADEYLAKPINFRRLRDVLNSLLARAA